MRTKTIIFLTVILVPLILNACNITKASSEKSESNDSLNVNEIVKRNADKYFHWRSQADSTNEVKTEISVIDSFTFKQNIDFRKDQINDSLKLTKIENKIMYYKKTISLLDSIEKSLGKHVNDFISYKYKYTQYTK